MAIFEESDDADRRQSDANTSAVAGAGLVAAVAALLGASCCALPIALAIVGLAGAWTASLAFLSANSPYLLAAGGAVVGLGWVIAIRRRAGAAVHVVLSVAAACVAAATLVTVYETEINGYLSEVWRAQ